MTARASVIAVGLVGLSVMEAACGSGGHGSDGTDVRPLADAGAGSDAGMVSDAGHADAAVVVGPPGVPRCRVEAHSLEVPIVGEGARTWDLMQWKDHMYLAYEVPACTASSSEAAQTIEYVTFASTGAFSAPKTVAGTVGDSCEHAMTPALAPGQASAPNLFFTSSAAGSDELMVQDLGRTTSPLRLTFDPDSNPAIENLAVAVPWGSKTMLAYVKAQGASDESAIGQIVTRLLGSTEQEIVPLSSNLHVSDLALSPFVGSSTIAGVLTYVASGADGTQIMAQLLDADGKPKGAPTVLSTQGGSFSNARVEMLTDVSLDIVGAVVYGETPDGTHGGLRFRTIDKDGVFGDEAVLTSAAVDARGIALVPFAGGFALVYRLVLGDQGSVRVRIVDPRGNTATYGDLTLTDAAALGSAPEAFVTIDGRFSIAFTDEDASGTKLRVLRGTCDP